MIENQMEEGPTGSRAEQLLKSGRAKSLTSGGSAPFVHWPADGQHMFIEGEVVELWEGKYGQVARLLISQASANAWGVSGGGDSQSRAPIETGQQVNVGLNYAALEGVGEKQVGGSVHIAFTGWGETKDGNPFRQFEVLEFVHNAALDDGPKEL